MSVLETPSLPLPALEQKLHTTARVRMLSWLCVGLALAFAAAIAAFATYCLIDLGWHLTFFGRTLAVLATGGMGFLMLGLGLWQAWRQSRDLGREALAVQQANPELGNALSASLLYGADADLTRRESSPAIVDRLVHATAATAERAHFSRAVSWRTPKLYALVALGLLFTALLAAQLNFRIFALTWQRFCHPWTDLPAPTWTALGAVGPFGTPENRWQVPAGAAVTVTAEVLEHDPGEAFIETRTENSDWLRRAMYKLPAAGDSAARYGYDLDNLLQAVEYRVFCGDAESARLQIPVSIDPELADLEVVITPPAFLHRAPTVLRGIGDVDTLTGSEVTVRARANKALAAGVLDLTAVPTATGTAAPAAARTVTGLVGQANYAAACEQALAAAKLHPDQAAGVPIGATDHDFVAQFQVRDSGQYTLRLTDRDGKHNAGELRYQIRARANTPAKVKITAPGKDVSVKTTAKVGIDITAEDDFSLREVGLYMMIDRTLQRKTLKRPADGETALRTSYDLDLGHYTFQGGEVITYWAFAVDEDGTANGREVTSEPQFMMTFAENNFAQNNQQQQQMSQQGQKNTLGLDQLIEDQKTEIKDTFALHMQMGLSFNREAFAKAAGADGPAQPAQPGGVLPPPATATTPPPPADGDTATVTAQLPPPADVKPEHTSRATTLAGTQTRIQTDLKQLIADVKEELAKLRAEQQKQPPEDGVQPGQPGPQPGQPQNGLGLKELALLEEAVAKMDAVQPPLKAVRPDAAVKPEDEALRLMSEARKLILSKNGTGQMKIALDNAQRKKQQRDRQQQDQQAQQTAQQMRKLPPMLDDLEDLQEEAKKLEKRLDDQQKQNQANQPKQNQAPDQPQDQAQTPEQKKEEENRRLARKQQEEQNRKLADGMRDRAQELADRAKETADRLREMNQQNDANKDAQRQRDQAAEKLEQTARRLANAADQTQQAQTPQDAQQAQKDLADAQQAIKDAAEKLNQSMQAQNRQRLDQAVQDAKDLEHRQNQLAQDTQALKDNAPKPAQGQNQPNTPQAQQNPAGDPNNPKPQSQTTGANGEQPQTAPQNTPWQTPDPAQQAKQAAAERDLAGQQKNLEQDLGQLRERLKELANQLEQNQPAGSPQAQAAQALDNAAKKAETRSDLQRDLANAAKELQNGNLERANDKQQSAAQGMSELRRQVEQAQAHNAGAARDELNQTLDQLADLHRKINQAKEAAGDPKQTQPDTAPLATDAAAAAQKVQSLAAADRQARGDAADKLNRAAGELNAPPAQAPADRQTQLGAAAQDVAAAAKQLERALQNLDQNQVEKTQRLVDQALAQQNAANQAMTQANQAKADQAAREERNAKQAAAVTAQQQKDAADQAAKADAAAQQAADRQKQAAGSTREIAEALKQLQTYLNGGQEPQKQAPPAAGDTQPRKLARAAADRFNEEKIPANASSLADKVGDLRDKQTEPTATAGQPPPQPDPAKATPHAPVQPKEAAAKWQEHRAAGADIETDLNDVKQRLSQLQAAIDQDELKRLEAAKNAVAAMEQKLGAKPQPQQQPGAAPNPPPQSDPQTPAGAGQPDQPLTADDLKQMGRDLEQLKGELGRLNLDEKTLAALDQAHGNLKQALQQAPAGKPNPQSPPQTNPQTGDTPAAQGTPQPKPGVQPQPTGTQPSGQPVPQSGDQPTFADRPGSRAGRDQLRFVRGGLERAIERVLEDRRIGNESADEAPRRYDALVDKYFEKLSDEQIDKQTQKAAGR